MQGKGSDANDAIWCKGTGARGVSTLGKGRGVVLYCRIALVVRMDAIFDVIDLYLISRGFAVLSLCRVLLWESVSYLRQLTVGAHPASPAKCMHTVALRRMVVRIPLIFLGFRLKQPFSLKHGTG